MTGDPARWRAVASQLDRLIDLDDAARARELQALRRRDPALAQDVSLLLRDMLAASTAKFLESAAEAFATVSAGDSGAAQGPSSRPLLSPGTVFGPYRVFGVLGAGGMGTVYEADEVESGRRVALKVLDQRLTDPRHRERFAREGRLAASIDHPHCVFVFGAVEIDGVPAIAMERMGGTLADRLSASGPLPVKEAVDAALQLIEGLREAARIGILHRDVKPSNCFVDADGVVKIGDFGISRSVGPTAETALDTGRHIIGTPLYASPEQLRGAELDERSDIYGLGATLHQLLTCRQLFEADDLMALLVAVANDPPTPPHRVRPEVPRGLSAIVGRCLAKRREDRFPSYDALADALMPYGSQAPEPASLAMRSVAAVLDQFPISIAHNVCYRLFWMPMVVAGDISGLQGQLGGWATTALLRFLYFGIFEAGWATSPGKALCRLTVADASGRPLGRARAWARAALFAGTFTFVSWAMVRVTTGGRPYPGVLGALAANLPTLLALGIFFALARRSNGYAALHDLVTRSRVVRARERLDPPRVGAKSRLDGPVLDRRGPFAVLAGPIPGAALWRPGLDTRLRRAVWIRDLAPGTPPPSAARIAIARPTRLRWLAGARADDCAWDAYEAVAGRPLAEVCQTPRPWADVRLWLLDLAQELAIADACERPPLTIERVWILESGRAKLLDDPTEDESRGRPDESSAASLLADVVRLARRDTEPPWPAEAERFVARLTSPTPPAAAEAARVLADLVRQPAAMSRPRRVLSLIGQAALPILFVNAMFLSAVLPSPFPPKPRLSAVQVADTLFGRLLMSRGPFSLSREDEEAVARTLAARFRDYLERRIDPASRTAPEARAMAGAILRRFPEGTPLGEAAFRPVVGRIYDPTAHLPRLAQETALVYLHLVHVAWIAVLSSLVFRTTLLRLLGLEVVTPDGRPASRLRVFARTAIAWSPILIPALGLPTRIDPFEQGVDYVWVTRAGVLILLAGAVYAGVRPGRGIQDRLAGTWLVPR